MADPAQDAAAGLLADLEQFSAEADEAATGQVAEQQQEETEEANPFPEINWDTPEELKDVLNTPDFEEEEVEDTWEDEGGQVEDEEFEDPRMAKKMKKLEKQLAWEREQRVKASRKAWAQEAQKYFQFSNPEVIQANSRRAFLKEAQKQHLAVAKVAKPLFDQLAAEKAVLREQALAEAKAEAEQRWGRPTSGPTYQQAPVNTDTVRRERLNSARGLTKVIGDKLKKGDVIL